uniref:Ovule protein n=1 Tax=Panagrellus redivivus TaxID=6233 RepID=A0A7E4W759_PANRE
MFLISAHQSGATSTIYGHSKYVKASFYVGDPRPFHTSQVKPMVNGSGFMHTLAKKHHKKALICDSTNDCTCKTMMNHNNTKKVSVFRTVLNKCVNLIFSYTSTIDYRYNTAQLNTPD